MIEQKNTPNVSFKKLLQKVTFVASPRSIWFLLVLFFLILNLIQVLLMGRFFYSVTYSEPNESITVTPTVESLSREHMMQTINDFSRRVHTFETLKTSYQAPADPSR